MRTSTLFSSIGLVLALGMPSSVALAGYAQSYPVSTDAYSGGGGYASGSVSSARSSADSQQFIGCETFAYPGVAPATAEVGAYCAAIGPSGSSQPDVSCSTSDPSLVATAGRINEMSYVAFGFNATGDCTSIYITNSSYMLP